MKNYNYVFVFYDIAGIDTQVGKNRVAKVFKTCKKYLLAHQKSVFRGAITPSNLMKLKAEILKIIDEKHDFFTIIKLLNEHSFEEESFGSSQTDTQGLFL